MRTISTHSGVDGLLWPWIRHHVTHDYTPSRNEKECQKQWESEWESIPIEIINRWVMGVPNMVWRSSNTVEKMTFMGDCNTAKLQDIFIYIQFTNTIVFSS
jgi:hypothetical protein